MASLLFRLGSFAARKAWTVIVSWVLILGLGVGAFLTFGGTLSNSFDIPGTASGEVTDQLADKLPDTAGGTGTVVYRTDDGEPFTDEQKQAISDLAASAEDLDGVASVVDPFDAQRQQDEQAKELTDGQAQLDAGRAQLDAGQAQLDDGRAQLETGITQLEGARAQADAAGAPPEQTAALDAWADKYLPELTEKARACVNGPFSWEEVGNLAESASQAAQELKGLFGGTERADIAQTILAVSVKAALPDNVEHWVLPMLEGDAVEPVDPATISLKSV